MQPIEILKNTLKEKQIDLAVISKPTLIDYFVGYMSEPHERILLLFVSPTNHMLFTPSLESADAKAVVDCPVFDYSDGTNPWEIINQNIISEFHPIHTVGIHQESMTVDKYLALKDYLPAVHFEDVGDVINEIKVIKSEHEKDLLMKAGELADKAVQVGIDSLRTGISEQEVVAKIEYEMKKLGVSDMSFPTMVLFGDHAGSPHGDVSDRQLKENEFVLFDLGVIYNGYASDMTRTVFYGTEENLSDEHRTVYETVLKSQVDTQAAVMPGMRASEVDAHSRQIIETAGYGEYYIHRLGHGLGQTAHEFPSLDSSNHQPLEVGMAFSIEPGIYIQGDIGVRIEDCVYLTENGAESFTHFDKSLQFVTPK